MENEIISALLVELKTLAAPDCRFCAHNTEAGIDACEEIDYDCDVCQRPCPCRNCNKFNNHAGWEWHGLSRRNSMDENAKDQSLLFREVLDRLKKAGVNTNSYKDVVIALETEIRHYRELIDFLERKMSMREPEEAAHADYAEGYRAGARQMAISTIAAFMETLDLYDETILDFGMEEFTENVMDIWSRIRDEVRPHG